jgi:hypothetical protein
MYKYNMSKKGPRPHTWRYRDPVVHLQHIAWMRMKAQADFRGEPWDLSFDEFISFWQTYWPQRGKASDQYCMTRCDPDGAWSPDNVEVVTRIEQLRRAQQQKSPRRRKNGQNNQVHT